MHSYNGRYSDRDSLRRLEAQHAPQNYRSIVLVYTIVCCLMALWMAAIIILLIYDDDSSGNNVNPYVGREFVFSPPWKRDNLSDPLVCVIARASQQRLHLLPAFLFSLLAND